MDDESQLKVNIYLKKKIICYIIIIISDDFSKLMCFKLK